MLAAVRLCGRLHPTMRSGPDCVGGVSESWHPYDEGNRQSSFPPVGRGGSPTVTAAMMNDSKECDPWAGDWAKPT